MRALWALLSVLAVVAASSPTQLLPREPLLRQSLPLDGAGALFELAALRPGHAYEVRVSYPATVRPLCYLAAPGA